MCPIYASNAVKSPKSVGTRASDSLPVTIPNAVALSVPKPGKEIYDPENCSEESDKRGERCYGGEAINSSSHSPQRRSRGPFRRSFYAVQYHLHEAIIGDSSSRILRCCVFLVLRIWSPGCRRPESLRETSGTLESGGGRARRHSSCFEGHGM